jgi:hypothetical protein
MSKRRSFGAEIEYNKDINKNNNGVIELIKRNLWESSAHAIIRQTRYTIYVVTTAIDFLVHYSRTPDEEEKGQRSILATQLNAITPNSVRNFSLSECSLSAHTI